VNTPDTEILLSLGPQHAYVAPFGASLRRYFIVKKDGAERDLLWGYSGSAQKKGGQGDALIPFPGRIREGRYHFAQQEHQLKRNDKDGPNAIHGFVRTAMWEVEHRSPHAAQFCLELKAGDFEGYPFSLVIRLSYELTPLGLECSFSIKNVGDGPVPVGAGFHPYFTVGTESIDDAEMRLPGTALVEFGADLLPTGRLLPLEGTPAWRLIGTQKLNHCYTALARDADGLARARLRDPRTGRGLTVWMDAAFKYLVVYTGDTIARPDARRALAIEPMTCATDAFNHPEWGLEVLGPGQSFGGRFGVIEDSFKGLRERS